MATDWDAFPAVGAAPATPTFPGVIPGRPKAAPIPTPPSGHTVATDARDYEFRSDEAGFDNATKLRTEFTALPQVQEYQTVIRQYGSALETEPTPTGDQALITAYAKMLDPTSVVREAEFDTVASGDSTFGKLYTKLAREAGLDEGGLLRPEVRARVRNEMQNLVESYNGSYSQAREQYQQFAERAGVDPGMVVGEHYGAPFHQQIEDARFKQRTGRGPEESVEVIDYGSDPSKWPWPGVVGEDGVPLPQEGGYGKDPETGEWGMYGRMTDDSPAPPSEAEQIANDPRFKRGDAAVLANQGFTMGLSDEAAGIGGAISNALMLKNPIKGYKLWNEVEDLQVARARKNMGWAGTAIEVGSGFGGVRTAAGALTGMTKWQGAKEGARVGALGGFGYGEGLEGTVINTGAGIVLGAGIGAGGQALGNKLASRAGRSAEERGALAQRAVALDAAGRAEDVTVNRAMVDPSTANRVTGVDATLSGGPRLQREMRNIEGQIEDRVGALGAGGRPMNEVSGGQTVERAGQRAISETGKSAKRKYDRAERLAGDARVEPRESLSRVNSMIDDLSETASTNADEIAYLETVRNDLAQDLSVGALRRMRTKLRKKISKGDLVFGEDEARVLAIMDGAADDIRTGLVAQGKADAADAFDAADKSYRARMEYISGTVQGLLGKRNANIPAERMWQRFQGMASNKGDSVGLRKFYASLTPEERLDVSATFADDLGRNRAGDFSVATFISQAENLSDDAIRTIFGAEGAQSIRNLRALGTEVKRVTGAMNSRTSKTGVANNYKDWLINGLLGASAGGVSLAGGGATAIGAGGVAIGANALRNAFSARMLMSTNITKWLRQAPRTANPASIDRHFAHLGRIAKAEPALAGDIEILRTAIMNAANDNTTAVASSVAEDSER